MIKTFYENTDFLKETTVYRDLKELADSDYAAAEIDTSTYKSVEAARSSYLGSIRRFGFAMRTRIVEGKMIIVKMSKEEM